ncbi:MAG: 16S rRNA (cytosine(1402)-N(4))-methyltransferase RsmH [Cytophagales bacterium]|nr:16S rRNA (cytosine(1402)-N(4))-methyltransferase RsmH [Cytophagales bacterium]
MYEKNKTYQHIPVLCQEAVSGLSIKSEGTYVDATHGGGGHAQKIMSELGHKGSLYAMDKDPHASEKKSKTTTLDSKNSPKFVYIKENFINLKNSLFLHKIHKIDGLLADLGMSSLQIDNPERGFSFRFAGPLDMRMDTQQSLTAEEVINKYSFPALRHIFSTYGELRQAPKIARIILEAREKNTISNTEQLKNILRPLYKQKNMNSFRAQFFKAIRIEVNGEMKALEKLLNDSQELIKKDGRIVVISYHSLEDRRVKQFLKNGQFAREPLRDPYGNLNVPFQPLHNKPIKPSPQEIIKNPRARSAKMRVGVKL